MNVTTFQTVLLLATLLCSLVAGFLFAFAAVVMPGIKRLDDGEFIRAFQVVDGVIQMGQPLFMIAWVGSVLALVAAALLGLGVLSGGDRGLMMAAAILYVAGVQLPTFTINIPLNNRLKRLDTRTMDDATRARARVEFEPRWNQWNIVRTACASLTALVLMLLLIRA